MGIGVSIFLFALGAILAFAVHVHTTGLDLNAVGVILMIVGGIGAITSMVFWNQLGFGNYRRTYVRDSVVDNDVVVERPAARMTRRVVREEEVR